MYLRQEIHVISNLGPRLKLPSTDSKVFQMDGLKLYEKEYTHLMFSVTNLGIMFQHMIIQRKKIENDQELMHSNSTSYAQNQRGYSHKMKVNDDTR